MSLQAALIALVAAGATQAELSAAPSVLGADAAAQGNGGAPQIWLAHDWIKRTTGPAKPKVLEHHRRRGHPGRANPAYRTWRRGG